MVRPVKEHRITGENRITANLDIIDDRIYSLFRIPSLTNRYRRLEQSMHVEQLEESIKAVLDKLERLKLGNKLLATLLKQNLGDSKRSSFVRRKQQLEKRLDLYYEKLTDIYRDIQKYAWYSWTDGDFVSERLSQLLSTVISYGPILERLFERFNSNTEQLYKFLTDHPQLLLNSGANKLLLKLMDVLPYDLLRKILIEARDRNHRTPLFYMHALYFLPELYKDNDQELYELLSIKDKFGHDMFSSGPFPISSRLYINLPKLPKKLPGYPIPTKDKQNETAIGLAGGSNNGSLGGAGRAPPRDGARPALAGRAPARPALAGRTPARPALAGRTPARPALELILIDDVDQLQFIDDEAVLVESSVASLLTDMDGKKCNSIKKESCDSSEKHDLGTDYSSFYDEDFLLPSHYYEYRRTTPIEPITCYITPKFPEHIDSYFSPSTLARLGGKPPKDCRGRIPVPYVPVSADFCAIQSSWSGEPSERDVFIPYLTDYIEPNHSSFYDEDFLLPPHYYEYRKTTPIEPITCYITPKFPEHINSSLPPATLARIEKMTADRFLHHILEEMTLDEREVLMCDEAHRRRTFESKWPHQLPATMPLQPDRLAANGFYHLGEADKVQCAFCRIILKSWDPHDDVGTEHKRHMPLCKLVLKKDCGNIPYIGFKEKLTTDDLQRFNVKRYDVDGPRAVPIAPEEYGINLAKPFRPEYAPIQTRKESFRIVKSDRLKFDIQRAIDSGFYYTGFEDYVRCFHCNGGLRNWSDGDDPHIEHARWFPICSYLIALKGREWVDNTFDATPTGRRNDKYAEVVKIDQKVEERRRDTREVMEDCIINMGFDKKIMKRAWRKDGPFLTMKEYLKSIYAIEDHGRRYEPLNARSVQVKPLHPKRVELSDSGAEASPVSDYTDSGSEGSLDLMAKDTSRVEEDEEMDNSKPLELTATNNKAEDIPDELKCRVPRCRSGFRSQATYLALPCGHITFCQNCVDYMDKKNKPLLETCVRSGCRTPVRAHMRFFTA